MPEKTETNWNSVLLERSDRFNFFKEREKVKERGELVVGIHKVVVVMVGCSGWGKHVLFGCSLLQAHAPLRVWWSAERVRMEEMVC